MPFWGTIWLAASERNFKKSLNISVELPPRKSIKAQQLSAAFWRKKIFLIHTIKRKIFFGQTSRVSWMSCRRFVDSFIMISLKATSETFCWLMTGNHFWTFASLPPIPLSTLNPVCRWNPSCWICAAWHIFPASSCFHIISGSSINSLICAASILHSFLASKMSLYLTKIKSWK